jgi:hypothetical protein
MLESAAMKRVLAVVVASAGLLFAAFSQTACSSTLSQPFENMKSQPITIHRLQNYEPPPAVAAQPGGIIPGLPPQIQQWLGGAAAALPPGLIPPGLLPGTQAPTADANVPRFYNFRILGTMSVTDPKLREEVLQLFGKESNFEAPRQSCMYAEFGFQIGQAMPPGQPQGVPVAGAPADILVSLSCDQVQMNNYSWPYGTKTGLTDDAQKKIVSIVQRAFGG